MAKFPINSKSGIILCHAEIRSKTKTVILKLALDTGATYTIIPFEAARAIGLNPAEAKEQIEIIMGGGVVVAPLIKVPCFKAFGCKITSLEVICHNLPSESSVEGLLGLNFLSHFNIQLNFPRGYLELI